jgi:plastocyanin/mono/diheme cytochrome c family protein
MRRPFVLGVLAALLLEGLVGVLVMVSGVVDVSATRTHPALDRVLAWASTRSIARHAGEGRNPLAGDPAAVRRGLEHYRDDCLVCHGAPGAHPAELAAGLHPAPPDLASGAVQSFTDAMLYATVAGGIDSTGMPAFGRAHSPDELWSIVAFLRHLPALTPDERAALGHEGHGEAPHGEGPGGGAGPAPQGEAAGTPTPPRPGQRVHEVSMASFKVEPATIEVAVGDVVEWKNGDFVAHTATADDHSFDTGQIDAGQAKRLVVRSKGRFPYFCRYHAAMRGTLVVK